MAAIKNEHEYEATVQRIEELLPLVDDDTPITDKNYIELDLLSDLVADYEEIYYPISEPTLPDVIKLRMYEMDLTQEKLAKMLNISQSRISDYLTGKTEPTLKIARSISKQLNIEPSIVLGV